MSITGWWYVVIRSFLSKKNEREATFMKVQSLTKKFMLLLVCSAMLFTMSLLSGCKGSDGAQGAQGPKGDNGQNGQNILSAGEACLTCHGPNSLAAINMHSGLKVDKPTATIDSAVVSSVSGSAVITINFTVKNSSGNEIVGLDKKGGGTSTNLGHLRFNMVKLLPGVAAGAGTTPNNWWPVGTSERTPARLVNNVGGLYTYTTGTITTSGTGTANFYDSTMLTRVVLMVAPEDGGDGSYLAGLSNGVNAKFDIAGSGTVVSQDVVPTSNCLACHSTFGNAELNPLAFHAGEGRVEMFACVACHYETRGARDIAAVVSGTTYSFSYGEAQIGNFIHKIHTSQKISTSEDFSGVAYPQDIRNCTTCHSGGTDSDNWKNRPSAKGCLSCHNPTNPMFGRDALTSPTGTHGGGQIVPLGVADHTTTVDDTDCKSCHSAATITTKHLAPFATTHNTGLVGAANFSYVISQVTVSADRTPLIKFQILNNGTPVTLNTGTTGPVLTGFSGNGPSLGVVYAAPQDGITAPSDWNSGHNVTTLQHLCDGTKGTLTDNGGNTYTANLKLNDPRSGSPVSMAVPPNATMITGYMAGAFTQGNWATVSSDPTYSVRPGIASFKAADNNTARRVIFSETKCNSCHEQLGTEPNFHGGSYNAAMCGLCHTSNQASSGWSASFRTWVHGIHGAGKRTVPYTWHAVSATENYSEIEYPGVLSNCEQCHLPGTYDFSAAQYTDDLIGRMLNVLDVSGTLASTSTTSYTFSPYVKTDTNYGTNWSIATNGTYTNAAGTTLVSSPITAVCTSCHDSSIKAIPHVKSNGGLFYTPRSQAPSH
jgi:OmcA/MtrC family decaheme c-type cytochrome